MSSKLRPFVSLAMIAGLALWLAGCGGKPSGDSATTGDAKHREGDGHDEHEGHDDHPHGPHDGELIELAGAAPGNVGHAEWTNDEPSGRVTVYILDASAKEELPIEAESVTIEVTMPDKEAQTYTLEAAGPDADGKASKFEIEDPELLAGLKLKDAVEAQLQVTIDGKNLTGRVEFVEHDEHHHH
jgi:hypothetical protein